MTGIVIRYRGRAITRREVRANATTTYYMLDDTLHGTNRGPLSEPNVIKLPTKYRADRNAQAYFNENTIKDQLVLQRIHQAFLSSRRKLDDGYDVVIPANIGIGTAKLDRYCPQLLEYIRELIAELENGTETVK